MTQSDDPGLVTLPVALAQQPLVQLAVRVPGQLVDEIDGARALVRRQFRSAVCDQFRLEVLEVATAHSRITKLHDRFDRFTHLGIGDAEYRHVGYRGMPGEDVFRLLRVDVHTAGDDHVGLGR